MKDGWRTYHWKARMPSTYGISVNVDPYALLEGEYKSRFGNTIPLKMVLPENKEKGNNCSPSLHRCSISLRVNSTLSIW